MTAAEQTAITGHPLLLYDGVCGFCNRVVRFLLRIDRTHQLLFIPLESPLAAEILARFPAAPNEPEGVILINPALAAGEGIFRRFNAVGEALRLIGGPYPILGRLLHLVPNVLREWSYGLIARYRYRLFGKYDTCPLPTPAQRSRILGV